MRSVVVFALLMLIKGTGRLLFRHDVSWVGQVPAGDRWARIRVAALLHHTSLLEIVYLATVPVRVLWRLARHGVAPAADVTIRRPFVGRLFRAMAHRVVSITRQRDETWEHLLREIGPHALVLLAPEGRMMRADGRDKRGEPMSIRGGIADILETAGDGRLLLVYSGGLHHVQVPGRGWPRLFQRVRLRLEALELEGYRSEMRSRAEAEGSSFKLAVIRDLEARKARNCPFVPGIRRPVTPESSRP
ncbi:MAG: hypothetical protein MI919_02910 [Holophagales bacterium]|nr:hypothetical protein [Holophagales bacterium]